MPRNRAASRSDQDNRTVTTDIAPLGRTESAHATGWMPSRKLIFSERKSASCAPSAVIIVSVGEANTSAALERMEERLVEGAVDLPVHWVSVSEPRAQDIAHQHEHARLRVVAPRRVLAARRWRPGGIGEDDPRLAAVAHRPTDALQDVDHDVCRERHCEWPEAASLNGEAQKAPHLRREIAAGRRP